MSFGVGGTLWSGEGGGFFGRGGFFWPRVTLRIGLPFPVFDPRVLMVGLGQEMSPADEKIVGAVVAGGKVVWDFAIGDSIDTGFEVYGDLRDGNYGDAAIGAVVLACDVQKLCKAVDKLVKLGSGSLWTGNWRHRGGFSTNRLQAILGYRERSTSYIGGEPTLWEGQQVPYATNSLRALSSAESPTRKRLENGLGSCVGS
ncbi:MAG: hypothetical protein F4169_12230 [Gammaproteobacteria bacterium]|nr:hypothetical protein [Gammaproteobacteria bacterium]